MPRLGTPVSRAACLAVCLLGAVAAGGEGGRADPRQASLLERGARDADAPSRIVLEGQVTVEVEAPAVPPRPLAVVSVQRVATLDSVHFPRDRAEAAELSLPVLDAVAQVLRTRPEIRMVRIEAHTDASASAAHNQALSERRAEWVRNYLIEHGVAPGRVHAEGFGASRPLAPNDSEEGRQANRRVDFVIAP